MEGERIEEKSLLHLLVEQYTSRCLIHARSWRDVGVITMPHPLG